MFLPAARVSAQVTKGEANVNLNATVSAGYTDDYTNAGPSDHSVNGAGSADLFGSYFNPNFLSFDIQPFYNQSRVNSNFQSLTSASGLNANVKLFSGGNFPGSISYSSSYNSSGNFSIPGIANYTTHGNNDVLAITWGVHLDDLPTLHFSYSNADSNYSVYGADTRGSLHSQTFSVTTTYQVAGFNMNGGYEYNSSRALTPEFLTNLTSEHSDSGASSFSFGVGHNLPLNGSFTAAASHLQINTNLGDSSTTDNFNSTIDTVSSAVNFAPRAHLNVGANTYYTDNLEGTLYNSLLSSGVIGPETVGQQGSHDLSLTAYANYELPAEHLNLHAFAERQQQNFLGVSFASDSYNGTATYSNTLWGGAFNGVLGLTRTSINTTQDSLLGVNASLNYNHQVGRWSVAGGFGYSQDSQTVLIAYTTSGYTYTGSIGRRLFRRSYWGFYASGARSVLSNEPGSANLSHSYTTSLSLSKFTINGTYTDSSGNALLTSTGLVTTPIPLPAVNPAAIVLFNGKSYTGGLGIHPVRGLTFSGTFSRALSGTQSTATTSNNNNEILNTMLTYNFRKLSFISGYSRLLQQFSVAQGPAALVGSFYIGVTRSFNFF